MNSWSWYWLIWFSVAFLTFIVPESIALARRHAENTLSNQVWRLEGAVTGQPIGQWTAPHFLVGGVILVLFVWLIFHFVWRIFT